MCAAKMQAKSDPRAKTWSLAGHGKLPWRLGGLVGLLHSKPGQRPKVELDLNHTTMELGWS